jgi:hypothetical protein
MLEHPGRQVASSRSEGIPSRFRVTALAPPSSSGMAVTATMTANWRDRDLT